MFGKGSEKALDAQAIVIQSPEVSLFTPSFERAPYFEQAPMRVQDQAATLNGIEVISNSKSAVGLMPLTIRR